MGSKGICANTLGPTPEGAPCGKEKIEIKERKGVLEREKMELWG